MAADPGLEIYKDAMAYRAIISNIMQDIINILKKISSDKENYRIDIESLEKTINSYRNTQEEEKLGSFIDQLSVIVNRMNPEDKEKVINILRDASKLDKEFNMTREFILRAISLTDISSSEKESITNIICNSKDHLSLFSIPDDNKNQIMTLLNRYNISYGFMSNLKGDGTYISVLPKDERTVEKIISLANAHSYGLYCETKEDFFNTMEDIHGVKDSVYVYKNVDISLAENFRNEMLEQQGVVCYIEKGENEKYNIYVDPANKKLADSVLFKNAVMLTGETKFGQEFAQLSIKQRAIVQNAVNSCLEGKNISGFIFNSNDAREYVHITARGYIVSHLDGTKYEELKPENKESKEYYEYEKRLKTLIHKLSANPVFILDAEAAKQGYVLSDDQMSNNFINWIKSTKSYDHNTLTAHSRKMGYDRDLLKAISDFAIFANKQMEGDFVSMSKEMEESPQALLLAYKNSIKDLDPEKQKEEITKIDRNCQILSDKGKDAISLIENNLSNFYKGIIISKEDNPRQFVPSEEERIPNTRKSFSDYVNRLVYEIDSEINRRDYENQAQDYQRENHTYDMDYYMQIAEAQKDKYMENVKIAENNGRPVKVDELSLNLRCYVYAATKNMFDRMNGKTDYIVPLSQVIESEFLNKIKYDKDLAHNFDVKQLFNDPRSVIEDIKNNGKNKELQKILNEVNDTVFNRYKSELLRNDITQENDRKQEENER